MPAAAKEDWEAAAKGPKVPADGDVYLIASWGAISLDSFSIKLRETRKYSEKKPLNIGKLILQLPGAAVY